MKEMRDEAWHNQLSRSIDTLGACTDNKIRRHDYAIGIIAGYLGDKRNVYDTIGGFSPVLFQGLYVSTVAREITSIALFKKIPTIIQRRLCGAGTMNLKGEEEDETVKTQVVSVINGVTVRGIASARRITKKEVDVVKGKVVYIPIAGLTSKAVKEAMADIPDVMWQGPTECLHCATKRLMEDPTAKVLVDPDYNA